MPLRLSTSDPDFEAKFSALLTMKREVSADVDQAVHGILADVRTRGDAALIELSARFDRVTLSADSLRVPFAEIDAAYKSADAEVKSALSLAAMRVMLSWKVGRFSFTPLPPCEPPPSLRTVQALLLDAAKAEDEAAANSAPSFGSLSLSSFGGPPSRPDDTGPPSSRA